MNGVSLSSSAETTDLIQKLTAARVALTRTGHTHARGSADPVPAQYNDVDVIDRFRAVYMMLQIAIGDAFALRKQQEETDAP
jgi:hypothetical protein